ncbi:hypothetical protein F5Y16DRAFT_416231 [Xylariaceae sp. FL0255]|nr:hypothetical protein F5Y16DRAFT_416231 [Xylariaceae sp. FL0255]
MRIGCLQFSPQVGDVDNNLNRADAVLSKANPEDLDLLVLPELSFSGYNFKSLQHINPYLEPKGSGITALWARTMALKYNCVVTVGYPEKVDVKPKWPTSPEYYNSVHIVNSDGETIGNYRKRFLYYTDETWALEGQDGFHDSWIPGLGCTAMGICDSPYKFEAPWHAFEFAFHCLEVEANLVIVTMAWLTREEGRLFSRMPNEPDMDSLTYWITRLEPLIRSDSQDEVIVVFCNRTGIEDDAVYAGTSAVIGIKDGEVNVYGLLGRGEKDLLVVDTEAPPYAKLVYRPDDGGSAVASVVENPPENKNNGSDKDGKEGEDKNKGSTSTPAPSSSTRGTEQREPSKGATENFRHSEQKQLAQPYSPMSQKSSSSHQSHASKRSYSSHRSHSSQRSQQSQKSHHSQRSGSSQRSPKEVAPAGATRDFDYVPLGMGSKAGSDRSTRSVQGSVSSRASSRSKTSNYTRPSINLDGSQVASSYRQSAKKEKVRSPPIQIPPPRMENDTIPTPTGPSPTPLAIRPKLIIPKDAGKKGSSHVSTPYPGGTARSQSSKTYAGHLITQQSNEIIEPMTAFEDMTPQSPNRFFWIPSDSMLKTPMELRIWTPALADSPTLSIRTPAVTTQPNMKSVTLDRGRLISGSSAGRASAPPPSKSRNLSQSRLESKTNQPIAPDSRNQADANMSPPVDVSRVNALDRADSPFANRPDWMAIAKRLDALAPRPDSAPAQKSGSASHHDAKSSTMPSRPFSPKSRNASRDRVGAVIEDPLGDQRQENVSRASITIGARASVLDNRPGRGPSAMYRPDSRMSNVEPSVRPMSRTAHYRSNSITQSGGDRPRAVSRGRQPGIMDSRSDSPSGGLTEDSIPTRRPSAPTVRFRSPAEFEAEMKRDTPEWSVAAFYGDTGEGDGNEIIGEIIVGRSPSCAIHGQRTEEILQPDRNSGLNIATDPETHDSSTDATNADASVGEDTEKSQASLEDVAVPSRQPPVEVAEQSPNIYSSSVETLASPRGSPATPQSLFNPTTRKAMALIQDDDRSMLETPLTAPFVKSMKLAKYRVQDAVSDIMMRPKSAVW